MSAKAARIRIIQITDVYTLENFPHLRTLIDVKKAEIDALGGKTISMLTGDFLAPYLLSSVDKGIGMMDMLNKTPIQYLIWGNHEHNLEHQEVLKREKEFQGVWINSNMKSHESFKGSKCQVDREVIILTSPDGSNKRKLGMMGILSNSANLYKPNAFGGATIDDPYKCMKEYNYKLKKEDGCDMVLPLCHMYEPQDEKTCNDFDFPVILSGHDHHRVDRIINGTRLLKPGMDAHYAVVLDLVWESAHSSSIPSINAVTIPVKNFEPNKELVKEVEKAYSVLDPLLKTDLTIIPKKYSPLTSRGCREHRVTMATFLCSQIKLALNYPFDGNLGKGSGQQNMPLINNCDCVLIKGGHFRGERDYDKHNFTLEGLQTEIHEAMLIHIFLVKGNALKVCMKESWFGPNPAWMQHDDGVDVDNAGNIIAIGGFPFNENMIYRVGSFYDFHVNYGKCPTLAKYFKENPAGLPDLDAGIGCHVLLLKLYSHGLWKKFLAYLDTDGDGKITKDELRKLDLDGDGELSKDELKVAIEKIGGLSTIQGEDSLVNYIMEVAGDTNKDGKLTIEEINKKLGTEVIKQCQQKSTVDPAKNLSIYSLVKLWTITDIILAGLFILVIIAGIIYFLMTGLDQEL